MSVLDQLHNLPGFFWTKRGSEGEQLPDPAVQETPSPMASQRHETEGNSPSSHRKD
jgi:hypothetical protein